MTPGAAVEHEPPDLLCRPRHGGEVDLAQPVLLLQPVELHEQVARLRSGCIGEPASSLQSSTPAQIATAAAATISPMRCSTSSRAGIASGLRVWGRSRLIRQPFSRNSPYGSASRKNWCVQQETSLPGQKSGAL